MSEVIVRRADELTKELIKDNKLISCNNCRNHTGVFAYCPGCKDFSNWQPKEKLK